MDTSGGSSPTRGVNSVGVIVGLAGPKAVDLLRAFSIARTIATPVCEPRHIGGCAGPVSICPILTAAPVVNSFRRGRFRSAVGIANTKASIPLPGTVHPGRIIAVQQPRPTILGRPSTSARRPNPSDPCIPAHAAFRAAALALIVAAVARDGWADKLCLSSLLSSRHTLRLPGTRSAASPKADPNPASHNQLIPSPVRWPILIAKGPCSCDCPSRTMWCVPRMLRSGDNVMLTAPPCERVKLRISIRSLSLNSC
eukprot:4092711-Prymnesium_polylepis.2